MTGSEPPSPPDAGEKDAAGVRVFPPGLPLLTVIAGVLLEWRVPISSGVMPEGPVRYILGALLIVGPVYALGFQAVREVRRSGQSENPYKTTTRIVDSGPFRFSRNPMYLQMVLACLGVSLLLANLWIALLTPLCGLLLWLLVIRYEEAYLERKFGAEYRAYKRRVRRWI